MPSRFDCSDRVVMVAPASTGLGMRFVSMLMRRGVGMVVAAYSSDSLTIPCPEIDAERSETGE